MAVLSPRMDACASYAPYVNALIEARSRYPEGSLEYVAFDQVLARTEFEIDSLTGVFRSVALALKAPEAVRPC